MQAPSSSSFIRITAFTLFATTVVMLSGCSGRVSTPGNLSNIEQRGGQDFGTVRSAQSSQTTLDNHIDMAAEEAITNGCVSAWRKACAGDEKAAMTELNALDKSYPKFLTIQMMMGQVLEHFGKTEAAIEHYRKAAVGNEFSSMSQFKLANAYRKAHRYEDAVPIFRRLLAGTPDFVPALIGLADCLAQKPATAAEGLKLAQQAAQLAPEDKDAQALVKQLSKQ